MPAHGASPATHRARAGVWALGTCHVSEAVACFPFSKDELYALMKQYDADPTTGLPWYWRKGRGGKVRELAWAALVKLVESEAKGEQA